ncbi:MAG: hypothetical protein EZS28_041778, partial [Streblomastix strix]
MKTSMLINREWEIIQIQIETIGSGGGSEEQDRQVINEGLINFKLIFHKLHQQTDQNVEQMILCKEIEEEVELKGGMEEIDSNQYHSKDLYGDGVLTQAMLGVKYRLVRQAIVSDLVQCVRRVRDYLSKENGFVRVEGVDYQVQKLVGFGAKFVFMYFCHVLNVC